MSEAAKKVGFEKGTREQARKEGWHPAVAVLLFGVSIFLAAGLFKFSDQRAAAYQRAPVTIVQRVEGGVRADCLAGHPPVNEGLHVFDVEELHEWTISGSDLQNAVSIKLKARADSTSRRSLPALYVELGQFRENERPTDLRIVDPAAGIELRKLADGDTLHPYEPGTWQFVTGDEYVTGTGPESRFTTVIRIVPGAERSEVSLAITCTAKGDLEKFRATGFYLLPSDFGSQLAIEHVVGAVKAPAIGEQFSFLHAQSCDPQQIKAAEWDDQCPKWLKWTSDGRSISVEAYDLNRPLAMTFLMVNHGV